MGTSLAKQYDPKEAQSWAYQFWLDGDYFHSEPNPRKPPYCIVIPPPNVTGALHMGHALNGTLQDILIRWRRMKGFEALWVPGTDHAGIATQAVVERRLREEHGLSRHDIGRAELVRRIWAWKDEYEARILHQLRQIGSSCDWARTRFTLDPVCARVVRHTFFRLFRDGLIYRGKRLVNWDAFLQTAVADDEIEHKTVQGHLWSIRYPVKDADRSLVVATTRPETMLGDTAVAVHPDDPRYRDLIGKTAILPLVGREIPIIADAILVNPEFGTGCVKVTPAHDPNDYQTGLRHGLEMINILNPDGSLNENAGPYQGLDRFEARARVVRDLEHHGLLVEVKDYETQVGHSDRSKTPIEPYLSDQWFVAMQDLAQLAMDAVTDGRVTIHPERYAKTYLDWLGEKRDWCISRQLWWGHRIPIWYCATCSESDLARGFAGRADVVWRRSAETGGWLICAETDLAPDALGPGHTLEQDPDVLDTWFSSALWPHSTLGWPEETPELKYYYPTSVLSTAREIITLWVARMVIMGLYNTGEVPFHDVFIHPVIQDGEGRPMKKTLGNGVDPLDVVEKYGADALRFTLAAMTTETQDIRMPVVSEKLPDGRTINTSEKFVDGRNFCNKLWNAARLILLNLEDFEPAAVPSDSLRLEDRWILSRLSEAALRTDELLSEFKFSEAAKTLRDFTWNEFCDWYLELIKPRLRDEALRPQAQRIVAAVLDGLLRLLHPTIPYVTEQLWKALGERAPRRGLPEPEEASTALIVAPWPQWPDAWRDPAAETRMAALQGVIAAVRNVRSRFNVPLSAKLRVLIRCRPAAAPAWHEDSAALRLLAGVETVEAGPDVIQPPQSSAEVFPDAELYVPLAEHIDVAAEVRRLEKELGEVAKRLAGCRGKLGNPEFVNKAPAAVVERQRELLGELEMQRQALEATLRELTVRQCDQGTLGNKVMHTPAELARQVEQFDDEQWYDFLDELDEVARRRRQRAPAEEEPDGKSRDEVAAWVAKRHLIADSSIREVWYLPGGAPPDEIRFLELNDRLAGNEGKVEALDFGLDIGGAQFRLFVADITSEQLDRIRQEPSCLPPGWSLDGNRIWRRRV